MNIAETLNQTCHCTTLDSASLARDLETRQAASVLATRPHLFSSTAVFVSTVQIAEMRRIIQAVESVVALPAYQECVLARAPKIARVDSGARGVFLGYDFHLNEAGARLIEINTNAGGGLLNLLLGNAQSPCCEAMRSGIEAAQPALERHFVEMFFAEWRRARGMATPLSTLAIVDDDPAGQYLYPEFLLFQELFQRQGLSALIVDAAQLELRDGGLWHGNVRIDLIYNRLTDFYLEESKHAALREAHETGATVLTPHPRAHALYADKHNLALLSDEDFLRELGAQQSSVECLLRGIPRTVAVRPDNAEALWNRRRSLFFKPAAGYGGKAAYRGDKLTRRVWNSILAGDYVAQETVLPSERHLKVNGNSTALKLDLRNYVYDGQVQLLAARLYQGQTTNFRTAGGGFAPVINAPEEATLGLPEPAAGPQASCTNAR